MPDLVFATEPCESCAEQAERDGGSALNLCNSKRARAYEHEKAVQEAPRG